MSGKKSRKAAVVLLALDYHVSASSSADTAFDVVLGTYTGLGTKIGCHVSIWGCSTSMTCKVLIESASRSWLGPIILSPAHRQSFIYCLR